MPRRPDMGRSTRELQQRAAEAAQLARNTIERAIQLLAEAERLNNEAVTLLAVAKVTEQGSAA